MFSLVNFSCCENFNFLFGLWGIVCNVSFWCMVLLALCNKRCSSLSEGLSLLHKPAARCWARLPPPPFSCCSSSCCSSSCCSSSCCSSSCCSSWQRIVLNCLFWYTVCYVRQGVRLVGSCLKTGQHFIFFNYISITAHKMYNF